MPMNNQGVMFKQRTDMNKSLVARDRDWGVEKTSQQDKRLCMYIRSVNLDIFWARAKLTVTGMVTNLHKGIRLAHDVGIPPPYPLREPCPLKDAG
eukprot:7774112-Ditylum_brightwellii.AAC.1